MNYLCKVLLLIGLMNNGWAFPWFNHNNDIKAPIQSHAINPINFTGVWVGQCDGSPAVDLTIKHDQNQFSVSYGFMKEHYVLGEVKSQSSYRLSASEHGHTLVNWNDEQSALIFINSNLFVNADLKTNVFFSEVSMSLKEDQLIISGQHYHKDSALDDFKRDSLFCVYNLGSKEAVIPTKEGSP